MKLSANKNEKLIIIGILLLLICGLTYYFIYIPNSKKKAELETKSAELEQQLEFDYGKTGKVPALKKEMEELSANISQYSKGYYVDTVQERYLYLLNKYLTDSNLKLISYQFSFDEDMDFDSGVKSIPASTEKTDSKAKNKKEPAVENNFKVYKTVATLSIKGDYNQIYKFTNLINNNVEQINISSVSIKQNNADSNLKAFEIFTEELEGTIVIDFYAAPKIAEYNSPESITSWTLQNSVKNPFQNTVLGLFGYNNDEIDKVKVHELTSTENIIVRLSEDERNDLMSSTQSGERTYPVVNYSFDESLKDKKLYVDLSNLNLSIEGIIKDEKGEEIEKINKVGLIVYSDSVSNSKLNIFIEDASGSVQTLTLADSIYWQGWASLTANLNPGTAFPIKIRQIEILPSDKLVNHKEGEETVPSEQGNILIDAVIIKGQKKVVEEQEVLPGTEQKQAE